MKAIYKRELKSYFSSVIGCLFISAVTLISGIFFVLYSMMQGYPTMEPSIFYAALGLVILIPVLTMKVMADERRQKTDQLILTAPVSLFKVVMAKYFALLTIFIIPILIMCTYPLIMSRFGDVSFKLAYTSIGGFALYGAALIAIGVFISSITELQIIAAIISIVIMLVGFFMGTITNAISQTGNVLTKVLNVFYTMGPLNDIMAGKIALSSIVYYISIIVLFLFLTCQSIQKRRWSVSKKTIGTGVFSFATVAIVMVLVVFVNLAATVVTDHVPAATVDTSITGVNSISDKTVKMLNKLDKDITIYVLSSKGEMENDSYKSMLVNILDRYEQTSKRVKVEYKDTKTNPSFAQQYTNSAPTAGSIIVVNKDSGKSRVVDYNDLFVMDQSAMMYGGQSSPKSLDAEGQIDSAITFVQSNKTFNVYQVEGHNEVVEDESFGGITNLTDVIEKHNCKINTIKLGTKQAQKVMNTDKCAVLLILGPQTDYTKQEAKVVKDYLELGGKVVASFEDMKSTRKDKPNFSSIFESYNIKVQNGVVAENDPSYCDAQYGPFFAYADGSEGFAANLSGSIASPFSIGLTKKDKKNDDITYTALASSTSQAVLKTDLKHSKSYTKEKGDVSGPFDFVVSVEKNVAATESSTVGTDHADSKKAEMLVFSSVYTLLDASSEPGAEIVSNALDQYIDSDVEIVSVPQKSLEMTPIQVTATAVRLCVIGFVIVIPIGVLLLGIIVWALRRKK